jgi:hypothetical protein
VPTGDIPSEERTDHQVNGLIRSLKPYFSRMFFAAVERRKVR